MCSHLLWEASTQGSAPMRGATDSTTPAHKHSIMLYVSIYELPGPKKAMSSNFDAQHKHALPPSPPRKFSHLGHYLRMRAPFQFHNPPGEGADLEIQNVQCMVC